MWYWNSCQLFKKKAFMVDFCGANIRAGKNR
jgi:hypothetical protein